MRILKGHRFRLDLDGAQAGLCSRTAGICRFLWNLALEQRTMAWNFGRHRVGYLEQARELPDLKKAHPWIAEAPSHCLQQTLRDLDTAFGNFFQGRAAYPAFRKKFRQDRFRFPDPLQFKVDEDGRYMKLPKLGRVAYRNGKGRHALKLAGKPRSITVSRECGHWYASVLCEAEVAEPAPVQGPPVGVDLGVTRSLTLSSGAVLTVAGMTRNELRRQARLQRALARKRKGSRNREKARRRLARFQAGIARRRRDSIHKITTRLSKSHGRIVLEDLRVKAMTASAAGTVEAPGSHVKAKAGLNRAILNVAFGEIRRQLEYKCRWHGSELQVVNPAYTSQTCHECRFTHSANRPSQAEFACGRCGHRANADVNAARNILEAGQSLPAVGRTVDACGGKASAARGSRKPEAQAPGIPFY